MEDSDIIDLFRLNDMGLTIITWSFFITGSFNIALGDWLGLADYGIALLFLLGDYMRRKNILNGMMLREKRRKRLRWIQELKRKTGIKKR